MRPFNRLVSWLTPSAVQVYSDGSAHERRGLPGGWAYVVVERERPILEGSGGFKVADNHQVELHAALEGLKAVAQLGSTRPTELISDSRVTLDIANGAEPPAAHTALGVELRALCLRLQVTTRWVRGHSGNRWNEHVDRVAEAAKLALVPPRFKRKARRLRT